MLRVSELARSNGSGSMLHPVCFTVLPGERIALIGPKKCGKTSLLRILAGEEKQDSGVVQLFPTDLHIGCHAQVPVFNTQDRLEDYIIRQEGNIADLSERLTELAAGLANQPGSKTLKQAYELVMTRLEAATENARRAPEILRALGLDSLPSETPVENLNSGQKARLALAGVLLKNPQIMLLDEPTKMLDPDMINWLMKWLQEYPGALLFISHNRAFLDQVATGILDIDPLAKTIRRYNGSYTSYLEQRTAAGEQRWERYYRTPVV